MEAERAEKSGSPGAGFKFRWIYIILPVIILVLSGVITAVFAGKLPAEVSYRYYMDGEPAGWINSGSLLLVSLTVQLGLALLSLGIVWGVSRMGGRHSQLEGDVVQPQALMMVMGNMVALPQVILFLAVLDIFLYNTNGVHLLPLWAVALIVLGSGGMVLGVFFVRVIWRVFKANRD